MHYGDWNDGWGGGWGWIGMAIMMVAFWGGIVWVAVTLLRRSNHAPLSHQAAGLPNPPDKQTAQEILAERLARGEIEPDDYRQRLDALQHGRPGQRG